MGNAAGEPRLGPLYVKMLESRSNGLKGARDIFGALSQTSQFKVCLHLTTGSGTDNLMGHLSGCKIVDSIEDLSLFDFYCAEAALPGASMDSFEEIGSFQGVREVFPTMRVYPQFTITLYVDNEYKTIRLFEEWMNFINPIYANGRVVSPNKAGQGNAKNTSDYFRLRYPNEYRKIISITKFERDFVDVDNSFNIGKGGTGGIVRRPASITYRMMDAYPTNITAIPVTYEGSTITRTSIVFNYSRYVIENHIPSGV